MFYNGGGESLEWVAQRSCGSPILGNIQGQIGRGSEQLDLWKMSLLTAGRLG